MFSPYSRSRDDLMAPRSVPVAVRFPGTEELCRESAARGSESAESLGPALSTSESRHAYGGLTLAAAVRPHLPMLRRVAKRILLCPEQAEDAVQDALIVLWERADRPVELRGWLVKTVIHRSLHRRRTEMRRRRWEEEASIAAEVTCPLCDPEEEFARREFLTVVEAAVAGLSSRSALRACSYSGPLPFRPCPARMLASRFSSVRTRGCPSVGRSCESQ